MNGIWNLYKYNICTEIRHCIHTCIRVHTGIRNYIWQFVTSIASAMAGCRRSERSAKGRQCFACSKPTGSSLSSFGPKKMLSPTWGLRRGHEWNWQGAWEMAWNERCEYESTDWLMGCPTGSDKDGRGEGSFAARNEKSQKQSGLFTAARERFSKVKCVVCNSLILLVLELRIEHKEL